MWVSSEATSWAWEQDLPTNEKLLLVRLGESADSDGRCVEPKKKLATWTGSAGNTVQANLRRLEDRRLLTREYRTRVDGGQDVSLIQLHLDPSAGQQDPPIGPPLLDPPADLPPSRGRANSAPPTTTSSSSSEEPKLTTEELADVADLLKQKRKVGGKIVTEREMLIAAHALSEFNAQLGSSYGLGGALTAIVGRIRDRPRWDAEKHRRLVQSAFRIRWWERTGQKRRPSPNVIYGGGFENVVQDAADEAAGRTEAIERRRYRKEV